MFLNTRVIAQMLIVLGLLGRPGSLIAEESRDQESSFLLLESSASSGLTLNLKGSAIPSDVKKVNLRINVSDLERYISNRATARIETIPNSNVFRKISGFDNVSLSLVLRYFNEVASEETSLLDSSGAVLSQLAVPAAGFVKDAAVKLAGDVTTEECLPQGACAVLSVRRDELNVSSRYDSFSDYRDLIVSNDRGVVIQKRISDETETSFSLQINDRDAQNALSLASSTLTGQGASSGPDFVGARGVLGTYGFITGSGPNSEGEAYKTVHVFPVGNALRLKVVTEPFYICRYTYSGEFYQSYPQKRGMSCTFPSGAFFGGAAPGQDERTEKSFDFFGLSYP